jgi:hypothetical protein
MLYGGKYVRNSNPRANAGATINMLRDSRALHQQIAAIGIQLSDNTDLY